MSIIDQIHGKYVFQRRVRVLSEHLASLLPAQASVLDVGCGDGLLAKAIVQKRPDVRIEGIDVLVREKTHIAVKQFDGNAIPYPEASIDVVMFVDVLHHTDDPMVLLREAKRVASQHVLIKDHTRDGLFADATLRLMDWVGNARHGVRLPYNYWSRAQWNEAFAQLELAPQAWLDHLRIYPAWADVVLGRTLHFIAKLSPR